MKKNISWYQFVEVIVFVIALILCIVIGVRIDAYSQTIANQIYNQSAVEGMAIAMIYVIISHSKFYAMFVLATIVTAFSIIGIVINKNARFSSIDYVIFAVSAICTIIGLVSMIYDIVNVVDVENDLQVLGKIIDIAFRCGFNMPINT